MSVKDGCEWHVANVFSKRPVEVFTDGHIWEGIVQEGFSPIEGKDMVYRLSFLECFSAWGPLRQAVLGE